MTTRRRIGRDGRVIGESDAHATRAVHEGHRLLRFLGEATGGRTAETATHPVAARPRRRRRPHATEDLAGSPDPRHMAPCRARSREHGIRRQQPSRCAGRHRFTPRRPARRHRRRRAREWPKHGHKARRHTGQEPRRRNRYPQRPVPGSGACATRAPPGAGRFAAPPHVPGAPKAGSGPLARARWGRRVVIVEAEC